MSQRYFAVIAPGLECALVEELRRLPARKLQMVEGGVEFDATGAGFYRVMHECRLANRLYLRVGSFRARDPQELFRKVARIEWSRLIHPGQQVEIEAISKASRIFGSGAVAERVKDGIAAYWVAQGVEGTIPSALPTLRLLVRLHENQCTLSLDAAGDLLHRRGWRLASGRAPLRENTAAALLQLWGWEPGTPLLDPMCGSGTFLIEAARIAATLPPRLWERYDFHHWANFAPERWAEVMAQAGSQERNPGGADIVAPSAPPKASLSAAGGGAATHLFGNEIHADILSMARDNAERAHVSDAISWTCGDALQLVPPCERPGWIVVNPPYGERLSRTGGRGEPMEQLLVRRCSTMFPGWQMGLLLPADLTPHQPGLAWKNVASFRNGGIPVRCWSCEIPRV